MITTATSYYILTLGILLAGMLLSVKAGKLTLPAGLAGMLVGFLVFTGGGYAGILMLVAFFLLGVLATAHKKDRKAAISLTAGHPQKRNTGQVLANGGMAGLLGLLAMVDTRHWELYILMAGGSLASATADTLSSELGMVYGRNFYNILSFKKDEKGLDGVVSMEGTLWGLAGAGVIACIYSLFFGFGNNTTVIVVAGLLGNLFDSVLGASLERRHFINNNVVNFLNTLFAALIALMIAGSR
jgi:uncharacterized protein (TIGR00297 family)